MKKIMLIAAVACLAMGCCKKNAEGEQKCCAEGENVECCEHAGECCEHEAAVEAVEEAVDAVEEAAEAVVEAVAE